MKINAINIENFLGIQSLEVSLDNPVTLFTGLNGAGKTSIAQAIRFALTGEASRVKLKKEWSQLVKQGAKSGKVSVIGDGFEASLSLPSGKVSGTLNNDNAALPYCLDMHRFSSLDDKERRKFLFSLTGQSASTDDVINRLVKHGASPEKSVELRRALTSGFGAAETEAKENASRSRGAWEAIAGEKYGCLKAESWESESINPVDDAGLVQAEIDAAQFDEDIASLNRAIGAADSNLDALNKRKDEIAAIRAVADSLVAKTDLENMASNELADFQQQFLELKDRAGIAPEKVYKCPHCAAKLNFKNGVLTEHSDSEHDAEAMARIPEYEKSLGVLQRAFENRVRDRKQAENAVQRLTYLLSLPGESVDSAEDRQRLTELKAAQKVAVQHRDSLRELKRESLLHSGLAEKALAHHRNATEWQAISIMLSPDGIQTEILSDALKPFNDYLAEISKMANWATPEITREMEIVSRVEGEDRRPYQLLSESEMWRFDAVLTIAIAMLSGLKIVILDRFDVLDIPGRGKLIKMLKSMGSAIETAIILGTTKAMPQGLPAGFSVHWINDKEVAQ